ncbi:MAG: hypothetical protein RPR28_06380 [Cycloclasticus sp.]
MGRLTASSNFGDPSARSTGEHLEWMDICNASAGLSDPLPWRLAVLKFMGDTTMYHQAHMSLVDWAVNVSWHEYAPAGKKFKVPEGKIVALSNAALWEYAENDVGLSMAQLAARADMARSTFVDWLWVYEVILQHLRVCEGVLERRLTERLIH